MTGGGGTGRIDAVFFDIDDTLYSTSLFANRARKRSIDAMMRLGLRGDRRRILAELDEVVLEFSSNYGQHYQKLIERLPPRSCAGVNPAVLVGAAVAAYHDAKVREMAAYSDVKAVLPKLARSGLLLGVITDGLMVKQAEKLVRLQVLKHLHPKAIFISDQVGIGKPNPKLFQRACRALRLTPARTMYVGDHPQKDIVPAAAIGMRTVRCLRRGKYRSVEETVPPDHVAANFHELAAILADAYGIRGLRRRTRRRG
jgi:putative hydrolase of the HAD superfamily